MRLGLVGLVIFRLVEEFHQRHLLRRGDKFQNFNDLVLISILTGSGALFRDGHLHAVGEKAECRLRSVADMRALMEFVRLVPGTTVNVPGGP